MHSAITNSVARRGWVRARALRAQLWTWGSNDYGRLGHGVKVDLFGSKVTTPTRVAYFAGEEGAGRDAQATARNPSSTTASLYGVVQQYVRPFP